MTVLLYIVLGSLVFALAALILVIGGPDKSRQQQSLSVSNPDAELSRLLFEAREEIEMWADVVEARGGWRAALYPREVVRRIDNYRVGRGWSRHGFGGEGE